MIFKHVVAQALICPSSYLGILRVQSQTSGISLFAASFINFTIPNHLLCLSLLSQLQLVPSKLRDAATLQSDSYTYTFRKNLAGSIVSVALSWQSMQHTFVKWRPVSTRLHEDPSQKTVLLLWPPKCGSATSVNSHMIRGSPSCPTWHPKSSSHLIKRIFVIITSKDYWWQERGGGLWVVFTEIRFS